MLEVGPLEALGVVDHIFFSNGRRSSPARELENQKQGCGVLDSVARS